MHTVFDGEGCIVIYISTANQTQLVWILQILVVRQVNQVLRLEDLLSGMLSHVGPVSLCEVVVLEDLGVIFDDLECF